LTGFDDDPDETAKMMSSLRKFPRCFIRDPDGTIRAADDLMEWAEYVGAADMRIARTELGPIKVSTIFLAKDFAYHAGDPLLFETMITGLPKGGSLVTRYATEAEALDGHAKIVAKLIVDRN
jgi:hypothetical protein